MATTTREEGKIAMHDLVPDDPDPDPEVSEGARSALCGLKLGELKAIAEAEGLKLRGIPWSACCPPDGGKRAIVAALLGSVTAAESPTRRQAAKVGTLSMSGTRTSPSARSTTPTSKAGTSSGTTGTSPAAHLRRYSRDTDSVSRGSLASPVSPRELELSNLGALELDGHGPADSAPAASTGRTPSRTPPRTLAPRPSTGTPRARTAAVPKKAALRTSQVRGRKEITPGRALGGCERAPGAIRQPAFPDPPGPPGPRSAAAAQAQARAQARAQAEIESLSRQIKSLKAQLAAAGQQCNEATEDAMDMEVSLQREKLAHRTTKLQRNAARDRAWELEQQLAAAGGPSRAGVDRTLLLLESSSLVLVQDVQERAERQVAALQAAQDDLVEENDEYDRTLVDYDDAFVALESTIAEKEEVIVQCGISLARRDKQITGFKGALRSLGLEMDADGTGITVHSGFFSPI